MFLNCSNHTSDHWTKEQIEAVHEMGETDIVDFLFPSVPGDADEAQVCAIAEEVISKIKEWNPNIVMCQGEFTLTYILVNRLLAEGITVVAASSARDTIEIVQSDGSVKKESIYRFQRFRKYSA